MDPEYLAYQQTDIAEKKLNPGCIESMCTSKQIRLIQAQELYEKAGNNFKLVKKWFEAGECFEKCAHIEESNKEDPSKFYEEAAYCFKLCDKKRSYQNLNKCISIYEGKGRFSSAGDIKRKIAENFESEGQFVNAAEEYQKAADYYEMESSGSKVNRQVCLLKVADLACLSDIADAFEKSKQIYEQTGMQYLSNPLMRSSAKDLFFKTVVVYLVYDVLIFYLYKYKDEISGEAFLNKLSGEDTYFFDSTEYILLKGTIEAIKEKNLIKLKTCFTRYKETNEVDKWKIHMFTKIMKKIEQEATTNLNDIDDFR